MQNLFQRERRFFGGHRGILAAAVTAATVAVSSVGLSGMASAHAGYGDLVEKLQPSVVNIHVLTEQVGQSRSLDIDWPEDSPIADTFKRFMQRESEPKRFKARGFGAGFIISEDGYIVTNAHVVQNSINIFVELLDGREFEAELVGLDPKTDIAVIRIDAGVPLPTVAFGDSDQVRVGESVLAIGNPLGLGFSVSEGIVSGRGRTLRGTYDDYIQTDAAINSGNSGGPLFNMDGDVIGVNTLYLGSGSPRSGGSSGIGFAMASEVVSNVVDQLIEHGATRRGWLGVTLQDFGPDEAEAMGLDSDTGTMIVAVIDGPASDAGIQEGDVITHVDGNEVADTRDLILIIADAGSGAEIDIGLVRQGDAMSFNVVLGSREEAEGQEILPASLSVKPKEGNILGLTLGELDSQQRTQMQLGDNDPGLLVLNVDESSDAELKGVRQGDLVLQINFAEIGSLDDVSDLVEDAQDAGRRTVLLLIENNGHRRYVALPIEN